MQARAEHVFGAFLTSGLCNERSFESAEPFTKIVCALLYLPTTIPSQIHRVDHFLTHPALVPGMPLSFLDQTVMADSKAFFALRTHRSSEQRASCYRSDFGVLTVQRRHKYN